MDGEQNYLEEKMQYIESKLFVFIYFMVVLDMCKYLHNLQRRNQEDFNSG